MCEGEGERECVCVCERRERKKNDDFKISSPPHRIYARKKIIITNNQPIIEIIIIFHKPALSAVRLFPAGVNFTVSPERSFSEEPEEEGETAAEEGERIGSIT